MICISPYKKAIKAQSKLFFHFYCSLLNSVCSRVQRRMEDITSVKALCGDTLIGNISVIGFSSGTDWLLLRSADGQKRGCVSNNDF